MTRPPLAVRLLPWAWAGLAAIVLLPLAFGAGSAVLVGGEGNLQPPARLAGLAWNSVKLAGIAAFGACLIGAPLALAWARAVAPRWRPALAALALAPMFVPPGIVAVAAVRLLGANGILTTLLMPGVETFSVPEPLGPTAAGLKSAPIFTIAGAGWTLAVCYAPIVFAALAAALRRGDRDTEDAALLEGGVWGTIRGAVAPAVWPSLLAGASLVFVFSLVEFTVPESLRSLPVLVGEVYVQFGVYYDTRAAFVASALLAFVALLAGAVALRPLSVFSSVGEETEHEERPTSWRGSAPLGALGIALALIQIAAIFGVLAQMANGSEGLLAAITETIRLAHEELIYGFGLALVGTSLCLALGGSLAFALASSPRCGRWRAALFLAMILPGPLWGVGMATLLRMPVDAMPAALLALLDALSGSAWPLLIAWTLRFAPLTALLAERALRRVPQAWSEEASLDGATWFQRQRAFGLHAAMPALAAAVIVTFGLLLGDVGAPVLLLPPGETTLSVRLMTLMHYAPKREVAALCLLGAIPPALIATVAVFFAERRR